jgi:HEAT repeat protein
MMIVALGQIGDKRALGPLHAALKDSSWDPDNRLAAINALQNMGDASSVDPLIAVLLQDGNGSIRKIAAEILGKLNDRRAVQPLIEALGDFFSDVRLSAAAALEKIGWQPSDDEAGAAYYAVKRDWNACDRIGAPAVNPLIKALTHIDQVVDPLQIVQILGKLKDSRAVGPLLIALKDRDERVCLAAIQALGEIRDSRAVHGLAAILLVRWGPDREREEAKRALSKIGIPAVDPLIAELKESDSLFNHREDNPICGLLIQIGIPAMDPLIAAFQDSDLGVSESASYVLEKIGDPAVKPLIAALRDSNRQVRYYAAQTLGRIGNREAIGPLTLTATYDVFRNVCEAALDALHRLGWEPNERDTAAAYYWISKGEWNHCISISNESVMPLIVTLHSGDWNMRKGAAGTLLKIFQLGMIGQSYREAILASREEIHHPHEDFRQHGDYSAGYGDDEYHSDNPNSHTDTGIGNAFPL